MSARPPLPPGPYLVVGLARSGLAAAKVLPGEVIGVDSGRPELPDDGFEAHLESDGLDLLDRVNTVIKSPGVPKEAPVIAAALERGMDVIGEFELAWRLLENDLVAVTGTNGKTTTTELLGAIHRAAGIPVAVAGNVGTPLASLVGSTTPDTVIVAEASSFQLEDSFALAPDAAVLLNVSEDHLDRHGDLASYRKAKLRAFANQRPEQLAVAPVWLHPPGAARRVTFGGEHTDLSVVGAQLRWRGEPLMLTRDIRMRGAHNRENAAAAAATALARGVPREAVVEALRSFAGVPHRLEEVAERDGVLWVNDSKATNVASAAVGIAAFEGGVHLILGGSLKGGDFVALREPVRARVRTAYLIGEATAQLAEDLQDTVPLVDAGDLEHAVAEARKAARPGEVVLLSPACASFDQYGSYEERGEHFRRLVG